LDPFDAQENYPLFSKALIAELKEKKQDTQAAHLLASARTTAATAANLSASNVVGSLARNVGGLRLADPQQLR